ncbi:DUF3173 family protein [Streptococcus sp. NSJ-72]|uniref:DUF3173 family protein n=1 Tax=Streptococcus sp. NSJ-72 TaxID=2763068 RepID=UPI001650FABA|nr:DUF3173 family protein [Streptococcus sp. NSJ-72]QNL42567.1 DUF3173 family protein [Streptococcus sp. NSJ-72]
MSKTITKEDLIKLGYTANTAKTIIKKGKEILVKQGFSLYDNKRVGAIPATIASSIVGFDIEKES